MPAAKSQRTGKNAAKGAKATRADKPNKTAKASGAVKSTKATKSRAPRKKGNSVKAAGSSKKGSSSQVPRGLIIAVLVLLAAAFLYGPAKDFYAAQRNRAIMQAQIEALNAANDAAKQRAQELSTEDGIKDEARLHGYVDEGETPINVQGLDDDNQAQAQPAPTDIKRQVLDAPDPWYISLGDAFFGYNKEDATS